MTKKFARIKFIVVIFGFLCCNVPAYGGNVLQVNHANIDIESDMLYLYGVNFDAFSSPIVSIGDVLLYDCSVYPTLIECSLAGTPAFEATGTWKVSISTGNSPHQNTSMDVYMPPQTLTQQCYAGDWLECYSGDLATRGVGECRPGLRTCQEDGTWSDCQGEVLPQQQSCDLGLDEDCDGFIDYADPDCIALCISQGNIVCDSQCIDINSDPLNCGACGNVCDVEEICVAGTCTLSCTPPLYDCGGESCSNINNDPLNCGACGNVCDVEEICVAGTCTLSCTPPLYDCGGESCSNINNDPLNCGACGNVCDVEEICVAGTCTLSCTPPLYDCGGESCSNINSDPLNCGACGNVCDVEEICVAGNCISECIPEMEICDGEDNDCDGTVDEGTICFDDDGDGYCEGWDDDFNPSTPEICTTAGIMPGDCDDANADISPEGGCD